MTDILSVYEAAATATAAEKKTSLLNGRYELTGRTLGDGTSGTVFEAIDHGNHEQRITIKICEIGGRISEYLEKLRREAVVGAGIPHYPNVCKTFDSFLIGSKFYIVMELVEGESFDIYICKKKPDSLWKPRNFFWQFFIRWLQLLHTSMTTALSTVTSNL
jgi:serine/threonine protein kinase